MTMRPEEVRASTMVKLKVQLVQTPTVEEVAPTERGQLLATAEMVADPIILGKPLLRMANWMELVGLVEGGALNRMKVTLPAVPAAQLGLEAVCTILTVKLAALQLPDCSLKVLVDWLQLTVLPDGRQMEKVSLKLIVSVREKEQMRPAAKLLTVKVVVGCRERERDCGLNPERVEDCQSIALRSLSLVVTLRLSTGSVVGGANSPERAKLTVDPAGTESVNALVMVTVCVEQSPQQLMVALLMEVVRPQQARVLLMGMRWLLERSRAQTRVTGKRTVMMPFGGMALVVMRVQTMSLVRLTVPPGKEMLSPLRKVLVKVSTAFAPLFDTSEAMVPMMGSVVSALAGLTMPPRVTITSSMIVVLLRAFVMVMVSPARAQVYPKTLLKLTCTSRHAKLASMALVYCAGKTMVAVALVRTGVMLQAVGLKRSSCLRGSSTVQVAVVLMVQESRLTMAVAKVKACAE